MTVYDFRSKFEYSKGEKEQSDIELLKKLLGTDNVRKTPDEEDLKGIDYVATLRKGAQVNIDTKTRAPGASRGWYGEEPELALEVWAEVPTETSPGKTGWTLDEGSNVDYILYTFDKSDSENFYFFPFQLLRKCFLNNCKEWINKYSYRTQVSQHRKKRWSSTAVFVPASVVAEAINKLMIGKTENV